MENKIKNYLKTNNPCVWFVVRNNTTQLIEAVQQIKIKENMMVEFRGCTEILFSILDNEFEKFKDKYLISKPEIPDKSFLRYNNPYIHRQFLPPEPLTIKFFQNILFRVYSPVSEVSFLQEISNRNLEKITDSTTGYEEDKYAFTASMIEKYKGIPDITATQISKFLENTEKNKYQSIEKELYELRKTLYYKVNHIDENTKIEDRDTLLPVDILFAKSKDDTTGSYMNYLYQLLNKDDCVIDNNISYRPAIKDIIFKEMVFCIDKFFRQNPYLTPYDFELSRTHSAIEIKTESIYFQCILNLYNSFLDLSNNNRSGSVMDRNSNLTKIITNSLTLYDLLPVDKINDIWKNRFRIFKMTLNKINVNELTNLNQTAIALKLKELDKKVYGANSSQNYCISKFETKEEFIKEFTKFQSKFTSGKATYQSSYWGTPPQVILEHFKHNFINATTSKAVFHFMFAVPNEFVTRHESSLKDLFERIKTKCQYSEADLIVMEKHSQNTDVHFIYCNVDFKHTQINSDLSLLHCCEILENSSIPFKILNTPIQHLKKFLSEIPTINPAPQRQYSKKKL